MEIQPENLITQVVRFKGHSSVTLNDLARSGVRWFHTIDVLCAIEFFIKYLLKRGTITLFSVRK